MYLRLLTYLLTCYTYCVLCFVVGSRSLFSAGCPSDALRCPGVSRAEQERRSRSNGNETAKMAMAATATNTEVARSSVVRSRSVFSLLSDALTHAANVSAFRRRRRRNRRRTVLIARPYTEYVLRCYY